MVANYLKTYEPRATPSQRDSSFQIHATNSVSRSMIFKLPNLKQ